MKKIIFAALLGVSSVMVSAQAAQLMSHQGTVVAENTTQLLYTQTAESAKIVPDPTQPGWFILTLQQVDPKTVWFTDRPKRLAGMLSTQQFVQQWGEGQDSFENNHPNASIIAVKNHHGKMQYYGEFELTHPQYNVATETLTYEVKAISKSSEAMSNEGKPMGEVALFVDGALVLGQCTPAGC